MFFEFALIGTTASGKSELGIKLAKRLDAVILSLDSLCLYKDINIASAKPSKEQLEEITHFGINLVYPNKHFCVGNFIDEYKKAVSYARSKNCPLIITGGSGFYLKAMLEGLSPKIPECDIKLSDDEIWEIALKIDEKFCAKFSKNDKFRLHKWYQIYEFSKCIPTIWLEQNTNKKVIENIDIYEIYWDKEELKDRIYLRTKKMLEVGLLNEANLLFDKYGLEAKSLKCIGLKECGEFLRGKGEFEKFGLNDLNSDKFDKNCILNELKNQKSSIYKLYWLIATHTIQLAKRQRTFNKSQFPNTKKVKFQSGFDEILTDIKANL
ncbi:tRNA delta(2)-isopentenylpyrophosphate transferase [Campylobacter hyointestinalis]|uniref:tRNA dimethylallyltransferase n=1 Tax=Campylobacter hyointestinalis subsp. hyointestinalis TaxID=91352 RepID=A0A0S4S6W3_CAMHY|nr:tRNA (adenosine(37)-N6)-dimethylallyltransferase MiaA [Campylobacter hyointestinalis]CUU77192.1 tRNA delta(2)-isopentenylpyrophosphate transferase [Campylobacter hyointestinalis subsp. hyointestinalis]CUU80245.1 tRNA delta(2)-isopentenylpyrophosphate transferase [Campylobacter hyointestinalis subsp. hyointestinalis]CUU82102.1 tRNA delta(2)-isopentenylpyrophosphate transferase [Campylobacter hyointestinalis subsp. hyointestinalis]CUU82716.1 tRNA delta(2)-isopentenylpyrophosphate transferase [